MAAVQHATARRDLLRHGAQLQDGESERLLGKALRPFRDAVTIATKVGPQDDPRASLEGSLSRLGADYVDLAQLHEAGARYEWSLERLHGLIEQGKTRAIGLCNATPAQIARAAQIAPIVTYQGLATSSTGTSSSVSCRSARTSVSASSRTGRSRPGLLTKAEVRDAAEFRYLCVLLLLILFAIKGSGALSADEYFRSYFKAGAEEGNTKRFFK